MIKYTVTYDGKQQLSTHGTTGERESRTKCWGEREREREGGSGEREWRKGVEKGSGEREWREKRGRCDVGESEGRDMMMYMKGRHTKHVI